MLDRFQNSKNVHHGIGGNIHALTAVLVDFVFNVQLPLPLEHLVEQNSK